MMVVVFSRRECSMPALTKPGQPTLSPLRLHDQRRFQRVKLNLLGRFMLSERREYPCQTRDISPGSAALITPVTARLGERAVAYVDQLGRIEGKVVRSFDDGFSMSIDATARKRDKLAAKLTWLANRRELDVHEEPLENLLVSKIRAVSVELPDGREYSAQVLNLSLTGGAFLFDALPPQGSPMMVGKLRASVVRHFEGAVTVAFATQQTEESLKENLTS
jgi:hypothetical protein